MIKKERKKKENVWIRIKESGTDITQNGNDAM